LERNVGEKGEGKKGEGEEETREGEGKKGEGEGKKGEGEGKKGEGEGKKGEGEGEKRRRRGFHRYTLSITSGLAATIVDGGISDDVVGAVHLDVECLVSDVLIKSKRI
jgi:hypothetical protein